MDIVLNLVPFYTCGKLGCVPFGLVTSDGGIPKKELEQNILVCHSHAWPALKMTFCKDEVHCYIIRFAFRSENPIN